MSQSPHFPGAAWPDLDEDAVRETVAHLHRLVQVAGKYTLNELFEPGWGNIVLDVTARGLRTPVLHQGGRVFDVHYRLLDHDVVVETDTGRASIDLGGRSVAEFVAEFLDVAGQLGLPAPKTLHACEIPGAGELSEDVERRPWDRQAAAAIWSALAVTSAALRTWEAPYRGHRPRVGVMWGGFDLSATRYRGLLTEPPPDRPPFMQHGMTEQYVSVGFAFADGHRTAESGLYAYVAPRPEGMETIRDWGVPGARWDPDAGLVLLPWARLQERPDPAAAVVDLGDAVYAAAVTLAGWPADLVGGRFTGWYASTTPPAGALTDR